MAAALLITFRETLEASLVVAITLTVLERIEQHRLHVAVWMGVLFGIVGSLVVAIAVRLFFSTLPPHLHAIAEGATMLVAAALIAWLVFWVTKVRGQVREHVTQRATDHAGRQSWWGICAMSFFAVVREGTETVLFLQASFFQAQRVFSSAGAVLGVVLAVGLTALLFRGIHLLPLRWIFRVTSVLLLIFAITLLVGGIGELSEAGVFL